MIAMTTAKLARMRWRKDQFFTVNPRKFLQHKRKIA